MVKWVKKGMAKRPTGRTRKVKRSKMDKHIAKIARRVDESDVEHKQYTYIPLSHGTDFQGGMLYLLNAMPHDRALVDLVAGIVKQVPGTQGPGAEQVLGNEYKIREFAVRLHLAGNLDSTTMVRIVIFRQTDPLELVANIPTVTDLFDIPSSGYPTGAIPEAHFNYKSLLRKDNVGYYKIYYDRIHKIQNQISAINDSKCVTYKKVFNTPLKVRCADIISSQTEGSTNNMINLRNNALWCYIFADNNNFIVDTIVSHLIFEDA